jgi:hypothetical protein
MSIVRVELLLKDCDKEIAEAQERLDSMSTHVSEIQDFIDEGMPGLWRDLDLTVIPGILEVLAELPDEIRKDPRNACYFDHLERILKTLSG